MPGGVLAVVCSTGATAGLPGSAESMPTRAARNQTHHRHNLSVARLLPRRIYESTLVFSLLTLAPLREIFSASLRLRVSASDLPSPPLPACPSRLFL